ncbi:MAG: DNA polymerase, partial [bacterium]
LKYRELEKLRNTYVDALPKLVGGDGRVHTKFDQLGAVTGRVSSYDPNLQNIPVRSDESVDIRKAFVAEEGFKIVSFDYSQIDLRVAAHISGDEKMIEAFMQGEDIHCATAREIFAIAEDKEIFSEMRRVAKTINFGILYGMSSYGLSIRSDITQHNAKEFIGRYFERFSGVAEYIKNAKEEAKKKGFVETIFGRKRYVKELQSRNWQLRASGERMAINMPIQGTSADIVKIAMRDVWSWLEKLGEKENIKILLQVHDELIFEIKDSLIEKSAEKIKNIMQNAAVLKVPLIVDIKVGENWGEAKKYA